MYTEFLLSGLNVMDVEQNFINKCRQRMPLAILGKYTIIETLEGFTLPREYQGVYTDGGRSNQQMVNRLVQNQVQNNKLCITYTDVLSHEDLAKMNQLIVSNHGADNNTNEMILKYYVVAGEQQDHVNNSFVYIGKKILGKICPSKVGFMYSEYHAEKVNILHIRNNNIIEHDHYTWISTNTMYLAVVVLPNKDTNNSMGIESDILYLVEKEQKTSTTNYKQDLFMC